MFTPAIQFSTVKFKQTPPCGYTLEYENKLYDAENDLYVDLPAWITETGHLAFEIYTANEDDLG